MSRVEEAFQRFAAGLEIKDKQSALVAKMGGEAVKCLKKLGVNVVGQQVIGAYARGTAIPPLAEVNVDFMVELHGVDHKRWQNSEGARNVLSIFGKQLAQTFPKIDPQITPHAIRLPFREMRLDVIPAFRWHTGGFMIPDIEREVWLHADPAEFANRLYGLDRRLNGLLLPLIRVLRAWNRHSETGLGGFHLECLVYRRCMGTGFLIPRFESLAEATYDMLQRLADLLRVSCHEPVHDQIVDTYLGSQRGTFFKRDRALDHAAQGAQRAVLAMEFLDSGQEHGALAEWAALLGEGFLIR